MDATTNTQFNFRLKRIAFIAAFAAACILARLFYLQIHHYDSLARRGERNFLRTHTIDSPRGAILDCNHQPMAVNRPVSSIWWQGTGDKMFTTQQLEVLGQLRNMIPASLPALDELLTSHKRNKEILLAPDISFDTMRGIIERFPRNANITFKTEFRRHYPFKELACHALGYLGSVTSEPAGKMGLERLFEGKLKGSPGIVQETINSRGTPVAQKKIREAQKGANLIVTLDLDLQRIAEEVFPTIYNGTIIAMNPTNGALKVVLSRPAFDPNLFADNLDTDTWNALQANNQVFLSRAFNALYPPASLFKLVTIAAAFEEKLITENSTWYCGGSSTLGNSVFMCNKHEGHGLVSPTRAIAQSCNIPFYELAKTIKIDTLADYAHRFGLGKKTESPFPEQQGLIPTAAWKRKYKGERWWPGETLSAAIGQSFMLVTPIQMVRMVAAICEGHIVRPVIVHEETENLTPEPLRVSNDTRQKLKQYMRTTVKRGTGQRLNRIMDMEIYAKTGTAQTSSRLNRHLGKAHLEHAWFVAYIKYKNYEPLAFIVLLEHAGSSSEAITVSLELLQRYCRLADARDIANGTMQPTQCSVSPLHHS